MYQALGQLFLALLSGGLAALAMAPSVGKDSPLWALLGAAVFCIGAVTAVVLFYKVPT